MGTGHREQRLGLVADRMGMGDRCVLPFPLATNSGGWLAPKILNGLIRIIAPLAWLSGLGPPRRPPVTVMPQSKGQESSQKM